MCMNAKNSESIAINEKKDVWEVIICEWEVVFFGKLWVKYKGSKKLSEIEKNFRLECENICLIAFKIRF